MGLCCPLKYPIRTASDITNLFNKALEFCSFVYALASKWKWNHLTLTTFRLMSTWHGIMAEEEKFLRCKIKQILSTIRSKGIQNMHTEVDPH